MRNLLIAILLVLSTNILSSTEVYLNIDNNVDGKEFKLNEVYTNAKGIKYKIARFEYYICNIILNDLSLENYILANSNNERNLIANYGIVELDKISMSFGVKREDNIDQDPNKYPPFHPLAPKDPAMHWGWAAGYRFWVVEGLSDPDGDGVYDKSFQYHVLGDEAFRSITFDVDLVKKNETIDVNIDFNIQKLLTSIDMTQSGVFNDFYLDSPEIRSFVDNIIPSGAITLKSTTSVETTDNSIEIYPNPAANYLTVGQQYLNSDYSIIAIDGAIAKSGTINSNRIILDNLMTGTYLIRISDSKGNINTAKFVKN